MNNTSSPLSIAHSRIQDASSRRRGPAVRHRRAPGGGRLGHGGPRSGALESIWKPPRAPARKGSEVDAGGALCIRRAGPDGKRIPVASTYCSTRVLACRLKVGGHRARWIRKRRRPNRIIIATAREQRTPPGRIEEAEPPTPRATPLGDQDVPASPEGQHRARVREKTGA